jgi:hypothetical protein
MVEIVWQIALFVERVDDAHAAVYVPGVADPKPDRST